MPIVPRIFRRMRLRLPGLGCLPNEEDERDYDFGMLGLKKASGVDRVSLLSARVPRTNQQGIPACVGNSVANAIMVREHVVGFNPEIPSRLYIYFNARRKRGKPVRVTGTSIRNAVKMLQKVGVPDEVYWPYSTTTKIVNKRPSWEAISHAYPRVGGKYYAIKSYNSKRVQDIRTALDNGMPVVFGTLLDGEFVKARGPVVVSRPAGKSIGRHAMVITGYQRDVSGLWLFEVLNSWGPNWRHNGTVWFHEDYIRWGKTSDLTIIEGWDKLRTGK